MPSALDAKKPAPRTPREDGEATKARIIEVAGRLFAAKGYAETTSKEINESAETSVSAVNYHFGSRDGLYEAVVRKVGEYMLNPEFLVQFDNPQLTDREKLEVFLAYQLRFDEQGWQPRLWAREVVAPSSIWLKVAREEAMPRLDVVSQALSRFTGIPVKAPELQLCLLNIMSPVISLLMVNYDFRASRLPAMSTDPATITELVKDFIFAGIDKLAKDYSSKEGRMHTQTPST